MTTNRTNRILTLLNVRQGEGKPVVLLILFSFFMGLALAFYFTASNAIFIRHFSSRMISLSFIASGIAVYLTWLLLSLVDKRLTVANQLIVKFIFVLAAVVVISFGIQFKESDVLTFIMYTFVRVLVYISLVTFWGIAGKLFNLRQGKRIFGLISTGEVISIIIGYFSIPLLLQFIKTPSLLFLSSFSFLICLVVALIIIKSYRKELDITVPITTKKTIQEGRQWKYRSLIKKPYFFLTSLMALLPIFGYLFVDFMFLHQTKHEFSNDQETIAKFFGYVLGFVAVVELIFKLFVSGRMLNKYGLKASLLSLPMALLISTSLAAVFGTFYGPMGMFFAFIVFTRLLERAVRGSIYEPAFQILYQPVPPEQRLAFQSQIEGIPKALGTIITGLVLTLFTSASFLNLVHYNWFFLLVLILWIRFAYKMYRSYRGRIKELLEGQKTEITEMSQQTSTHNLSFLNESILKTDPKSIRHLFRLAENIDPVRSESMITDLLSQSPVQIKTEIISYIEQRQIIAARESLKNLLSNPENESLASSIRSALKELDLAESYSLDLLTNLSKSKETENRETAARLLAYSPRYKTIQILSELMVDKYPGVKKAALIASGKVKRFELWPGLVENLTSLEFGSTASAAIRNIGEPILGELENLFRKSMNNTQAQMRIIKLYREIGGEQAIKYLRSKINFPEKDIRIQVLIALSLLGYKADSLERVSIRQTIENIVEAMVWTMATIVDTVEESQTKYLHQALNNELIQKKEHIFLLLSLMYDSQTIGLIRKNIESGNNQSKIFALEISDMVVSLEIKDILLPLFDDISIQERLQMFSARFPQEKLSRYERLVDIINKDYNVVSKWTKACALELLVNYDRELVSPILCANIINPSQVIRETAAWVLHTIDIEKFFDTLALQKIEDKKKLEPITKKLEGGKSYRANLLVSEKIESLKSTGLFSVLPDLIVSELAMSVAEMSVGKDETLEGHSGAPAFIYVVLSGQIVVTTGQQKERAFKSGDIFIIETERDSVKDSQYIASKETLLLKLDIREIYDIMTEQSDFTQKFIPYYIN
jgi:HEAT repeat protein/predicted MFS family arabinose efflux permease